jgi:hypothetical protein
LLLIGRTFSECLRLGTITIKELFFRDPKPNPNTQEISIV